MNKPIALCCICIMVLFSGTVFAGPVFNTFTNTWEIPETGSRMQYNPMEDRVVYAPERATLRYNMFEGTWDLVPKEYIQKYNPYTREWETTSPTAELAYDPVDNSWEYSPVSRPDNPFSNERYTR